MQCAPGFQLMVHPTLGSNRDASDSAACETTERQSAMALALSPSAPRASPLPKDDPMMKPTSCEELRNCCARSPSVQSNARESHLLLFEPGPPGDAESWFRSEAEPGPELLGPVARYSCQKSPGQKPEVQPLGPPVSHRRSVPLLLSGAGSGCVRVG